ncbi:MAG TPA: selenocysteine-specific translation elongation factor [Acidimicrobiia bacterium]
MDVIATAGHVDHGKSTLIVALTGRDPDRFAEEKRRGLTIDLGFAWTVLPSGSELGFVDVPGHERFIGNMLAGVGGVRSALLVVAADEGWMPQTEEHHEVLRLLEVERGIVAITKTDLVEPDRCAAVQSQIAERAARRWPIVEVSARTGAGLAELRAALDRLQASVPPDAGTRPRLWVDRSFTVRGAGTVVTGTLQGGSLQVDEEVDVMGDRRLRARVRTIQTHERARDVAVAGSRVALNLVGVDHRNVRRGDAVCLGSQWWMSDCVDARVTVTAGARLDARGAYLLYLGTAVVPARIRSLPAHGMARLRLSRPLPIAVGDRFVVRDTGRGRVVAGGAVLDVDPAGPIDPGRLRRREAAAPERELLDVLLAERDFVPTADAEALAPGGSTRAERAGAFLTAPETLDRLGQAATDAVARHHDEHPSEPGVPVARLGRTLQVPDGALGAVLARTELVSDGETVHAPGRRAPTDALEGTLAASGLAPPPAAELDASARLLRALVRDGVLVMAGPFAYRRADFDEAVRIVRARIDADGPQTTSALRAALGITRKHALPLLEEMDRRGVTRRRGDGRE